MPWYPIRHYRRDNGDALPPPDSSDEDKLAKIDEQPSAEIAIPDQDDNDEVEVVESIGAAGSNFQIKPVDPTKLQ